jgi:NDP-sugar pyrophosphorylase family protein
MKAMILAAGVGSRLRPLTDTRPKALVEINGVPMLEIVLRRIIKSGFDEIVVNVFHFADMIVDFLRAQNNFGIRIEISRETELLDTGGGLKKVADFFDDGRPFLVHNVDVISNIDLNKMYRFHVETAALATLAVQARATGRYFLFDKTGRLCGWESVKENRMEWTKSPVPNFQRLAFNGIHVISPEIFPIMSEEGVFSIIRTYLRVAGEGKKIMAFRVDDYYWRDIGRPENLETVQREVEAGKIVIIS